MKTLTKIALALALFVTVLASHAQWVNGYTRNDGTYVSGHYRSDSGSFGGSTSSSRDYSYQNPYAAYPSERVSGYTRNDGATVLPYTRTRANNTETDNLNYSGYGTVRTPRNSYGW